VAILAFVALCFDNSLFWLTRGDVGPSAIEFFLKCAALYCVARFARDRAVRWVLLLLATLALGIFNKLNFIWFANAAVAVSLVEMAIHRRALRTHLRPIAAWVSGLAVIYGAFAAYYFGEHIASTEPTIHGSLLAFTWPRFDAGTRGVISGTWFYDYALAPLGPRNIAVALVLGAFVVGGLAASGTRRTRHRPVAYVALTTILVAIQILLTASATAGWHYISIYPFLPIVAAYGVYVAARALVSQQFALHLALTCVAAVTIAYDGILMAKYFNNLSSREPSSSAWSPAIYQLSRKLQTSRARVFTADWGIDNALFALHQSRRYAELAFALEPPPTGSIKQAQALLASGPGPKLVVTHANDKLVFPLANSNLFRAAGPHLRYTGAIDGRDGRPVYETYLYQ
jgi:hypothetical protein